MSDHPVSRRAWLGYAGAGVAAAGVPVPATGLAAPSPSARTGVAALVAPLIAGSTLGRWRVEELIEPTGGAASVVLTDAQGALFQLDICARDTSALARRGPAVTEHFEIFLANQGDGAKGTHEDHGLCALAIGELIRGNEAQVDRSVYSTLAERSDAKRHVR